ncbi:killer cell lectin-like receptor 2 isoform X1 [Microcebus murinus]|uniref:killer cell lectin-like receptor 2 isoform X1 n=1 Tax=Microcebus murinus TaxID=30608 RepID=UPI003F6C489E
MSDQGVIYSTVRFLQSSSESESGQSPDVTLKPGKTDDKEFSVSWRLIAVSLGILCLLLLVIVTVLVTNIFQCIQERHQQQEILGHLSQKDNYLKEQLLINKTLEYDILKNESLQQKKKLDSLFLKNNICHIKNEIFSKSLENTGKHYEAHWTCCGLSCYYFAVENKNWKGCKQTCRSYKSSLLKIDDEDELTFVQLQIYKNNYWIGLSYDERESKWKWVDSGSSPGINVGIMNSSSGRGKCAFLSSTRVAAIDCIQTYNCICEKRIGCSIFSASACTEKKR